MATLLQSQEIECPLRLSMVRSSPPWVKTFCRVAPSEFQKLHVWSQTSPGNGSFPFQIRCLASFVYLDPLVNSSFSLLFLLLITHHLTISKPWIFALEYFKPLDTSPESLGSTLLLLSHLDLSGFLDPYLKAFGSSGSLAL